MPEVLAGLDEIGLEGFEYPDDTMAALQENEKAWENFRVFSASLYELNFEICYRQPWPE
jgi:hypothetical protein